MTDYQDVKVRITKNYQAITTAFESGKSGIVLEGGSRSGKTWAILQWLQLSAAITDTRQVITMGRDTMVNFKDTVWLDFKEVALDLQIGYDYNETKTRASIAENNCLLRGVGYNDDIMKTHGLKQDVFWINEAMNVSRDTFDQLEQRTSKFWIIDYNPSANDSWLYQLPLRPDVAYLKTTVLDNPFAPEASRRKILSYEPTEANKVAGTADAFKWSVYGLGERAVDESAIFQDVGVYTVEPDSYDLLVYGGDFGFTDDPTVMIQAKIDGKRLYLKEIFRDTGLTNQEIAKLAEPYADEISVWDSAEMKSVQELRLCGINAIEATKGADSVIFGIQKLKQFKLFIHAESSEMLKEFKGYKFAKGRNGDYIRNRKGQQVPMDKNNHSIDATRYAVTKFRGL